MKKLYSIIIAMVLGILAIAQNTVKCNDGTVCKTVKIGTQEWLAENLNTSTFNNGDKIPEAKTKEEWIKAGKERKPVWCYYNNESANGAIYGRIYNFYVLKDSRGITPTGWKIPNFDDWVTLIKYVGNGGDAIAGGALKETGTTHWKTPNIALEPNPEAENFEGVSPFIEASPKNSYGFTALPGGFIIFAGDTPGFMNLSTCGYWWSLKRNSPNPTMCKIFNNKAVMAGNDNITPDLIGLIGMSIRLVK